MATVKITETACGTVTGSHCNQTVRRVKLLMKQQTSRLIYKSGSAGYNSNWGTLFPHTSSRTRGDNRALLKAHLARLYSSCVRLRSIHSCWVTPHHRSAVTQQERTQLLGHASRSVCRHTTGAYTAAGSRLTTVYTQNCMSFFNVTSK